VEQAADVFASADENDAMNIDNLSEIAPLPRESRRRSSHQEREEEDVGQSPLHGRRSSRAVDQEAPLCIRPVLQSEHQRPREPVSVSFAGSGAVLSRLKHEISVPGCVGSASCGPFRSETSTGAPAAGEPCSAGAT